MRLEVILESDLNKIPKNNKLKIQKDDSTYKVYFIECLVDSIFLGQKDQKIRLDVGDHILIVDEKQNVSKISTNQFEKDFGRESLLSYTFMSTKTTDILYTLSQKNNLAQKDESKKGIEKQ